MANPFLTQLGAPLSGGYLVYFRHNSLMTDPPGIAETFEAATFLGSTEAETFRELVRPLTEEVFSDERGTQAPIDEIFQTHDFRIEMTLQDINRQSVLRLTEPFLRSTDNTESGFRETGATPGSTWTAQALGGLKLVPIYTDGPLGDRLEDADDTIPTTNNIWHFYQVGLDTSQDLVRAMGNDLHKLPVTIRVQPCRSQSDGTGREVYGEWTDTL